MTNMDPEEYLRAYTAGCRTSKTTQTGEEPMYAITATPIKKTKLSTLKQQLAAELECSASLRQDYYVAHDAHQAALVEQRHLRTERDRLSDANRSLLGRLQKLETKEIDARIEAELKAKRLGAARLFMVCLVGGAGVGGGIAYLARLAVGLL